MSSVGDVVIYVMDVGRIICLDIEVNKVVVYNQTQLNTQYTKHNEAKQHKAHKHISI